jgi:hypothetical protein
LASIGCDNYISYVSGHSRRFDVRFWILLAGQDSDAEESKQALSGTRYELLAIGAAP